MSVTLLIPTALRAFTERQKEIPVEAKTVGEAIHSLATSHPEIRQHLYEEDGQLRSFINVFVGDTNIKSTGGLETQLHDGDKVMLVPAIAGGYGLESERQEN
jgi:molybdopterin converting factor small subunit